MDGSICLTSQEEAEVKRIKTHLHQHPEASSEEFETTKLIKEKLTALGIELVEIGIETGAVGVLRAKKGGPSIALRADIDALRCTEKADVPEPSLKEGVMHACGHDFHTASLLGAAMILSRMRESLQGDVVFVFQPAEETTNGAQRMIDHGLFEKVHIDAMFGTHNRPEIPAGSVMTKLGALMAAKATFGITVNGVGGHGAIPQACTDPIVCAAAIISATQTIVSRNVDPLRAAVVSICSIHGGNAHNLIPDELAMTGSIRVLDASLRDDVCKRLEEIVAFTGEAYGCKAYVTYTDKLPALENKKPMHEIAVRAAQKVFGADGIVDVDPCLASEDFSLFMERVPSFFYWVGSGVPGAENPPWHNARFRTDNSALKYASALLAQSVFEAQESLK